MSNKESAVDRLKRMQSGKDTSKSELVEQLAHENSGEPDFAEMKQKLKKLKKKRVGENDGFVKMTIYIKEEVAEAFNELCVRRGDQKAHGNQAIADYVVKKSRELLGEE